MDEPKPISETEKLARTLNKGIALAGVIALQVICFIFIAVIFSYEGAVMILLFCWLLIALGLIYTWIKSKLFP